MNAQIRQDRLFKDIEILKIIINYQLNFEFKQDNFNEHFKNFKIKNNISLNKNYYTEVSKKLKYYKLEINFSYIFKARLKQLEELKKDIQLITSIQLLNIKLNKKLVVKNTKTKTIKI